MTAIATGASENDLDVVDVDDAFDLDVRFVGDLGLDVAPMACTTNDGCAPTCASSCISKGE